MNAPKRAIVTRLLLITCLALFAGMSTGCSVVMAANQPGKKDLKKFDIGTPRGLVIADFGQPTHTEIREGKRTDIFVFVQGYDKFNKGSRMLVHGVADVFTGFLWEIAATPGEMIADGDKMVYEIRYDPNEKIAKATLLEKKVFAGDEVKNRAK